VNVLVFVCSYEGCRRPRAWRRAHAQSAHLLLCLPRRVVMAALGRQPRRRSEQPAKCSWTPHIVQQAWLAGGEAVGTAGRGKLRASSPQSCCHVL